MPDDIIDFKDSQRSKKYLNWREAAYDKPVNTNSNWRSNRVTNNDTVFNDLRKISQIVKQNEANQLPLEYQEITPTEALKAGFCEETRQQRNIIRKQLRNQFYHNKGLHRYEE